MRQKSKIHEQGFTLVEAVIGTAVFAIIIIGVYALFLAGYKSIGLSKARTEATAIANQKIETIRNMPYTNIGTTAGWPTGNIPSVEDLAGQGMIHHIVTRVTYVDDPFDGTAVGNNDDYPWDYKKISVQISWERYPEAKPVTLTTTVAPAGRETEEELGSLFIHVINAEAGGVPEATINVTNDAVSPNINITDYSDTNGDLLLYGLPETTESYHIVVSKDGYTSAQTYTSVVDPENPDYNPYPDPADASVAIGSVTNISLAIDLVSTMNITTLSQDYASNWKINTDETDSGQNYSTVGIDNANNSYFTWRDYRDNKWTIYSQKYNPLHEQQWPEDIQLISAANQGKPANAIDIDGNDYIAWHDDRTGNQDSYLQKYSSGGVDLWSGGKKIPTSAESADQINPDVTTENNSFCYLAWQDNRNGHFDIYGQKCDSNGNMLWGNEKKININSGTTDHINPAITFSQSGNIYITWQDGRDGNQDIFAQKLDSNGNILWDNDKKVNSDGGSANQERPVIVAESGGTFYVAWEDARNGNKDIYAQKMNPDGEKQWSNDLLVNGTNNKDQSAPAMDIDEQNNIYLVWQDEQNGNSDIYSQKYNYDGQRQWSSDQKINTDGTLSNQEEPDIAAANDGSVIIYTWQDERGGNQDIYGAEFGGPGSSVLLPFVPLRVSGKNKIIGRDFDNTPILKYNESHTTDANGNLILNNMEWDSYQVVPEENSGYVINLSDPGQPIQLDPDTTINVTLNLTTP